MGVRGGVHYTVAYLSKQQQRDETKPDTACDDKKGDDLENRRP
jgi:hypothetical protein